MKIIDHARQNDRASRTRNQRQLIARGRSSGIDSNAGFTLVEVMISFFVFLMMCFIFGATFPVATRASHVGDNYSQASLLTQHKIDQLRDAGYAKLNGASLANLGIVDSATPNADGSYSFALSDHLVTIGTVPGFFPVATGSLWIGQALPNQGASAPSLAEADQVTVTIQWSGGGGSHGQVTTHTIIASN